jgi:hypothetical protein
MTIESTLERIAIALEAIAKTDAQGVAVGAAIAATNAQAVATLQAPKAPRSRKAVAAAPSELSSATTEQPTKPSSGTEDLFGEDASPAPSAASIVSTKTETPTAPSEEEDLYGEAPKAAAATAATTTTPTAKAKALTVDDVRAKLVDLQTKAGTSAAAKDMIKKYSKNQTTVISSVPEDKFVAMVAEIDAALAKK